jgi:hypothetical protein
MATAIGRRGSDDRRPPVLAPSETGRVRGEASLPAHRAGGRIPVGGAGLRAGWPDDHRRHHRQSPRSRSSIPLGWEAAFRPRDQPCPPPSEQRHGRAGAIAAGATRRGWSGRSRRPGAHPWCIPRHDRHRRPAPRPWGGGTRLQSGDTAHRGRRRRRWCTCNPSRGRQDLVVEIFVPTRCSARHRPGLVDPARSSCSALVAVGSSWWTGWPVAPSRRPATWCTPRSRSAAATLGVRIQPSGPRELAEAGYAFKPDGGPPDHVAHRRAGDWSPTCRTGCALRSPCCAWTPRR